MKTEFAVFWKRAGCRPKQKIFKTRRAADNYLVLFGPTPWKAWGRNGDDRFCCSGYECGCEGATIASEALHRRSMMPALEYIGVRVRSVSEWVEEFKDYVGASHGCGDCDPCLAGRPDQCAIDPVPQFQPPTVATDA